MFEAIVVTLEEKLSPILLFMSQVRELLQTNGGYFLPVENMDFATVALASAAAVTIGGRLGLEKSPQDKEERIGNQFFQNHRRAGKSDYLSLA